ncbi:MAG TPA: hypothetical protein DDZ96_09505 [Porphyromonadaceae bacterium]|jgi:hypothetical protein|nr:hypothetical protein [Porphyromonadaceae bacterium]HBK30342.1 hypothetical protein [Porphyromonadaceae bacterium]HBL34033.1 hypothetical protein [Porphyromonadaceae bacterium]HBX21881.1 hypothetical protein [Porphyromonadaceae bacterium]HBX45145.1 hypothetical protein [Porphyromonadaceae bacterium]
MEKLLISFSRLTTTGLGTLGRNTLEVSKKSTNATVQEAPLYLEVVNAHTGYERSVLKNIYSGLGPEVKSQDLVRDRLDAGFHDLLTGFAAFDDEKGLAARQLLEVWDDLGAVSGLNYGDETEVLHKKIETFSSEENQALLTTVGLVPHYEALKKAQEDFDVQFLKQVDANSALRQQPSASTIRHQLEDALRDYYGMVSALRKQSGWSDLYHDLDEVLKAAKRSIHDKNDEDEKTRDKK